MGNLRFAEQFVREEIITGTIIGQATGGLYESNAEIERILTKVYEQLESWVDQRVETIIRSLTHVGADAASRIHELNRLQALKADMTRKFAQTFENADQITREMQKKVGELGVKQADQLIIKELKDARVPASIRPVLGGFPKDRIDGMIGLTTNNKAFSAASFGLAEDEFEKMRESLIRGSMLGENPNKIADRIHKQIGVAKERAITVSRTAVMHTHRRARIDRFREHADVVDKWIWSSAADDRTCAACWAMHGTEHDLDEEMVGHPRCRCVPVPKTKSWEDLGIYGVDDTVEPFQKGEDKFRKLSPDKQRKILGDTGWYHWAKGNIRFKDFAGYTQHPTYGKMVVKRSLKSMGIDASYKGRQALFGVQHVAMQPGVYGSSMDLDARLKKLDDYIKWTQDELDQFREAVPALKEELKDGFIDQSEYEDQLTETLGHISGLEATLYEYKQQRESLLKEIDKTKTIDTVTTRTTDIDSKVTELRNKIAALEQRAARGEISPNTLKTQRYKLNKQIKDLEAKRVIKPPPTPDPIVRPDPEVTPDPVTNLTPDQKQLKTLQDELAEVKKKIDLLHERAFRGEIKPNTLKTQEYKFKKEITRLNNEIAIVNARIAGGERAVLTGPESDFTMTITEVTPPTATGEAEISKLAQEVREKGHNATSQDFIALGKSIRESVGIDNISRMTSKDFDRLKTELYVHREFGYDKAKLDAIQEFGGYTFDNPELDIAFRKSLEKLPKEWTDRLFDRINSPEGFAWDGLKIVIDPNSDRGAYWSTDTKITIPTFILNNAVALSKASSPPQTTALQQLMDHEVMHLMEHANPGIVQAEKHFYNKRTLGDKEQPLGAGYAKDEVYKKDKWSHKYMGKSYPDAMELMTMANEKFLQPDIIGNEYLNNDQEFVDWHIGMLAGSNGRGIDIVGGYSVDAPIVGMRASAAAVSPELQKLLDKEMLLAEKLATGQIVQSTYKTQMYKIKKQKQALANVATTTTTTTATTTTTTTTTTTPTPTAAQYQTISNDITAWSNMFAQPLMSQADIDQYNAWKGKLVKEGYLTFEQMVHEVDKAGTYKDELTKIKQLLGSNLPTTIGTSTIAPGGGADVTAVKKITDKLALLEDKMAKGLIAPSTYKTQKYKLNKQLKDLGSATVTTTKTTTTTTTVVTPPVDVNDAAGVIDTLNNLYNAHIFDKHEGMKKVKKQILNKGLLTATEWDTIAKKANSSDEQISFLITEIKQKAGLAAPTTTTTTTLTADDQTRLLYITQTEKLLKDLADGTLAMDEIELAIDVLVKNVDGLIPESEFIPIDMAWNDIGDYEGTLKQLQNVLKANVNVSVGGTQTTFTLNKPLGTNPGGEVKPGKTTTGLKANKKLDEEIVDNVGLAETDNSRNTIRNEVLKDPDIVGMLDAYIRRSYKYAGTNDMEGTRRRIVREHIDRLSDHWNGTSGDNDPDAVRTQIAAQQEFGLDENQLWYPDYAKNEALNASASWHGMSGPELIALSRVTLREMHNQTVRELKAAGITHVTVYRGQYRWRGLSSNDFDALRASKKLKSDLYVNIAADMQPLNSFSTNISQAAFFGDKILQVTVPVENILSIPRTGAGVSSEHEVVLINTNGTKGKLWFHEGVGELKKAGGNL